MIKTSVTIKASKTTEQLLAALNKALLAHPECVGMTVRKLTRLDNSQGLANWDAEFAAGDRTTISAECKRVFISAKQSIQKHFDLAGRG
jgi:LEA14-like dessication related protein